jgi:hypothetical protein
VGVMPTKIAMHSLLSLFRLPLLFGSCLLTPCRFQQIKIDALKLVLGRLNIEPFGVFQASELLQGGLSICVEDGRDRIEPLSEQAVDYHALQLAGHGRRMYGLVKR